MELERFHRSGRVSVGMPVFNGERFVEEAIDSILEQSYQDFELVISDNASTDRTEEICRAYAAKDKRVVYVRNRVNYGVAFNFSNVFRLSSGQYFKWAASDDVCGKDFLLRCVEVLDQDPSAVIAYPKTVGVDAHGARVQLDHQISDANAAQSTYSPDPVVRFRRLMRNPWWVQGPFFGLMRSEALNRTRLHGNFHGGDHVLITELALLGRFFEIEEDLFFLRMHAGKGSAIRTLSERIAFMDTHPVEQRGVRLWRLTRGHVRRISGYLSAVWRSSIDRRQKALCAWEVALAVKWWLKVRGVPNARRALITGESQGRT
jgi:glycosyltransferase involved in cell wall biosynthesis